MNDIPGWVDSTAGNTQRSTGDKHPLPVQIGGAGYDEAVAATRVVAVDPSTGDPIEPLVLESSSVVVGQAAQSVASALLLVAKADRVHAHVTNDSAIKIYWGPTNAVTTANGDLIPAGQSMNFDGYTGAIYLIAASGTPNVTYAEY